MSNSRVHNILLQVRDSLGDYAEDRWEEDRLLRLVDAAQKSIALQSNILRGKATIPLIYNESFYDLPDDCRLINKVSSAKIGEFKFLTQEEAELKFGWDWESQKGEPAYAVYDRINARKLVILPKPDNQFLPSSIKVQYYKIPSTIHESGDELEIPVEFDLAIKYFVTGMAWRDSKDTQNRALAQEEMQFYTAELRQALKHSRDNFTGQDIQYRSRYSTGFNTDEVSYGNNSKSQHYHW